MNLWKLGEESRRLNYLGWDDFFFLLDWKNIFYKKIFFWVWNMIYSCGLWESVKIVLMFYDKGVRDSYI